MLRFRQARLPRQPRSRPERSARYVYWAAPGHFHAFVLTIVPTLSNQLYDINGFWVPRQANELADKASNLERKEDEIRKAADASRSAIPSEERELDEAKARVRDAQDALNPAK